ITIELSYTSRQRPRTLPLPRHHMFDVVLASSDPFTAQSLRGARPAAAEVLHGLKDHPQSCATQALVCEQRVQLLSDFVAIGPVPTRDRLTAEESLNDVLGDRPLGLLQLRY